MKERLGEIRIQKNDGSEPSTIDKKTSLREKFSPLPNNTWLAGPLSISLYGSSSDIREKQIPYIPGVLATKYPDLYKQLSEKPTSSGMETIAVLSIDSYGLDSKKSIARGETPAKVAMNMKKESEEALRQLARYIAADVSPFDHIEYFVGFSRLAHGARLLGFDVFLDPAKAANGTHSSKMAAQNHHMAGHSWDAVEQIVAKHAPALAVLPKARLLELYGKERKNESI
ncbi:MAG: hypothetical protein Q7S50_02420 [bacterium]|nr:hypothetical protein [bacterium]